MPCEWEGGRSCAAPSSETRLTSQPSRIAFAEDILGVYGSKKWGTAPAASEEPLAIANRSSAMVEVVSHGFNAG